MNARRLVPEVIVGCPRCGQLNALPASHCVSCRQRLPTEGIGARRLRPHARPPDS